MTVIGIALYTAPASTPDPRCLRWALVLHPKRFDASDKNVSMHYVKRRHTKWEMKHVIGRLASSSSSTSRSSPSPGGEGQVLLAVLHLATIPNDFGVLLTYLKSFPPLSNLDCRGVGGAARAAACRRSVKSSTMQRRSLPSASSVQWSSAAWVVYVLTSMARREMLTLPCAMDQVYDYVVDQVREVIDTGLVAGVGLLGEEEEGEGKVVVVRI